MLGGRFRLPSFIRLFLLSTNFFCLPRSPARGTAKCVHRITTFLFTKTQIRSACYSVCQARARIIFARSHNPISVASSFIALATGFPTGTTEHPMNLLVWRAPRHQPSSGRTASSSAYLWRVREGSMGGAIPARSRSGSGVAAGGCRLRQLAEDAPGSGRPAPRAAAPHLRRCHHRDGPRRARGALRRGGPFAELSPQQSASADRRRRL